MNTGPNVTHDPLKRYKYKKVICSSGRGSTLYLHPMTLHNPRLHTVLPPLISSLKYLHISFIRYKIDKLDLQESYQIELSVIVCIDGTCETVPIVSQLLVPIPFCNTDGTLSLPGGSIDGYLGQLGGVISYNAIDLVLKTLGIKVIKKKKVNCFNLMHYPCMVMPGCYF